jgi:hypothetical protein
MARKTRAEREEIASKRIQSVLAAQGVANLRTLEQKIADAGPNPLRVQPHILTDVKNELLKQGTVAAIDLKGAQWLHLASTPADRVQARLAELGPLWEAFTACRQTGQALEIAVFRAILEAPAVTAFGGFHDLTAHGDDRLYAKEEVKIFNGNSIGNRSLDFIVNADGIYCGIEVKNIRPWLYPHDKEVIAALQKALKLGVVPVIIARRIPYVTFRLLGTCGVVMHETYNQRMANADAALADRARHKDLLGYHDIRVGNLPDQRLTHFMTNNLAKVAKDAEAKLKAYDDLLSAFANEGMPYNEFAARVRRRQLGQSEDNDWKEQEEERRYWEAGDV